MKLHWRDFQVSKPMDKRDKMDKSPDSDPFCPYCPYCPCDSESNSDPSSALPSPAEDTPADPQPAPVDTPAPDDDWRSAIPPDTMRRIIEREQAGWTEERRQAHEDEIRRIEDYRRWRGPASPGQAVGIPRAESLQAVGEVLARLGAIWPDGLEPDPQWQAKVGEAERAGNREAFHSVIEDWEASEIRRVEAYMSGIRDTVAGWPDEYRRRFALMVKGFWDGNRGMGITVRGLNPNAAMDKAYRELLPYVPGKGRDTASPATAPADDFPFTDMHPRTREILLRHWHAWGADRRQRFEKSVRDVMKETGYKEGNAAAFVFEKWRKR